MMNISIRKARDKVKILHWSGGSFVFYCKRIECGAFEVSYYDVEVSSISLCGYPKPTTLVM